LNVKETAACDRQGRVINRKLAAPAPDRTAGNVEGADVDRFAIAA
jgi:hypothetical protein